MSKLEILAELPKLNLDDRLEIFSFLCDLEEKSLNSSPSAEEKRLLDKALVDYAVNPEAGSLWDEVKARIFINQ